MRETYLRANDFRTGIVSGSGQEFIRAFADPVLGIPPEMMLVYHDDAEREHTYGPAGGLPNSHIGTFSDALLSEATARDWSVISMKRDWNQMFTE